MPPNTSDIALAREVAAQVVQAGNGRVRRVVMVGSRALGTAKAYSDLDLVVLLELSAGAKPWGMAECAAERERIGGKLSNVSVKVELWLRTTDDFEENRRVECSLEWRVDSEGVEVYRRPLDRPAFTRRAHSAVRRENVFGWISHGVRALEAALGMENEAALRAVHVSEQARRAAHAAVMRTVTALLVRHRIHASKHDGLEAMIAQLSRADPTSATRIRACLGADAPSARTAHAVVSEAVGQLLEDDNMRALLNGIRVRLGQPAVFLTPAAAAGCERR